MIQTIRDLLTPIAPWEWRSRAGQLYRGEGWGPPMMAIAALGVIIPLNFAVQKFGNAAFAATFTLTTTLTWLLVATIANGLVISRGVRNLRRYGLFGFQRPNWWFELSQLTLIAGLFAFIVCLAASLLPLPFFAAEAVSVLFLASIVCAVLFFLTTTVGYLFAFATRYRPRSKAFQCVQYFYGLGVPMLLLFSAALLWPAVIFNAKGMVVIAIIALAAAFCVYGSRSVIIRHEEWKDRRTG